MNYTDLEIAILRFLLPRIGITFTPQEIYAGMKETQVDEERFNVTLNILIEEGLVRGQVNRSLKAHTVEGISSDGIKALRKGFGADIV